MTEEQAKQVFEANRAGVMRAVQISRSSELFHRSFGELRPNGAYVEWVRFPPAPRSRNGWYRFVNLEEITG